MEPSAQGPSSRAALLIAVAAAAVVSAVVAVAVALAVTRNMSLVAGPAAPPSAPPSQPVTAPSDSAPTPEAPESGPKVDDDPRDTDADPDRPAATDARLGEAARAVLDHGAPKARLRFVVPEGVVAVRVRATTDGRAITCSAIGGGGEKDEEETVIHASGDPGRLHEFSLTEHASDGFPASPLLIEVEASDDPGDGVAVDVLVTVVQVTVATSVAAGEEVRGEVSAAGGHRFTFAVGVPKDAKLLRLDLTDCERDLDIFAELGGPTAASLEMEWGSSRPLAEDSLVCEFEEALGEAAVVHVTVLDPSHDESPVPFTVLTSTKPGVPARLREVPALPRPADPRARALLATVEIVTEDGGGSGVLVSPEGHVLTACHVVERWLDADAADPGAIGVAVCLDPRKLSKDLFVARVLRYDQDRDLALLRIVSGARLQPLPKDYRFPAVPLAPGSPTLGDPVQSIGYPGIGGMGTRSPVTLSRGTLSGFDRAKWGLIAKTDALVSSGSSGGGIYDASWSFCGITVSTVEDGSSNTLGWYVPVEEIPAAWREEISR